ncbi:hypothetical protein [Flagellimonas okinawensis]|uniref:Uncharacterized protein n=1 Tax=Flagellimonas okinawensis TaxID=3031324 RepID=A0ABT5XJB8_9FLAO|nr:hypothetical protein [[Muricauda] okinawensis]MDF0705985.1 hypothetical protein [[Muricauda] okinawensis]
MIPKTFEEFESTLSQNTPPKEWSEPLRSLWFDANGDWQASHDIAQDIHSTMGGWIHAYLHRKEGDEWNAGYWYNRANKPFPQYSLEEELKVLVEANL